MARRSRYSKRRAGRHATRQWHLEIPRGFQAPGLSSEENARRELQEEAGANASRLRSLGRLHADTGLSWDYVDLFHASVERVGKPESGEAIGELFLMELAQFERVIQDGQITDSFTIAAYARARLNGLL
jgi:ADP-ribose pyrophosphatase